MSCENYATNDAMTNMSQKTPDLQRDFFTKYSQLTTYFKIAFVDYFIRFFIFLENKPSWCFFFPDTISPFLLVLGLRLSVAGQPLFLLQEGVEKAAKTIKTRVKMRKFFMEKGDVYMILIGLALLCTSCFGG